MNNNKHSIFISICLKRYSTSLEPHFRSRKNTAEKLCNDASNCSINFENMNLTKLSTLWESIFLNTTYRCSTSGSLCDRKSKMDSIPKLYRTINFHNSKVITDEQEILHSVQCTLYTVHCTQYTVHCTQYTVHCILYSVHCALLQLNIYTGDCLDEVEWRCARLRSEGRCNLLYVNKTLCARTCETCSTNNAGKSFIVCAEVTLCLTSGYNQGYHFE